MPLVYPNMQMSEVVEEHPSLIPVINRFGIRLGLGDKSVKAICEEYRRGILPGKEATNFPYFTDYRLSD